MGADPGRAGIDAAGGLPLAAQMLGGDLHPLALDAGDHRPRHLGGKIGILPEAFLAAAPPGIPQHVQSGHQGQVNAHRFQLFAADLRRGFQQLRAEAAAHGQVDGEQIAVQGLVTVGTFGAEQNRNAQPGVVEDVFLHKVGSPGRERPGKAGVEVLPRPGIRPVEAVEGSQAGVPLHLLTEFLCQLQLRAVPFKAGKAVEPLVQLAHLLPQRHPPQQILRPLLRGQSGILIWIHRIPPFLNSELTIDS